MTGCQFHTPQTIPADGTPTRPSPAFARWREHPGLVPLRYADGHQGLVVTRYDDACAVLADPRFSQQPQRMPASHAALVERVPYGQVDPEIEKSATVSNLLAMDGEPHLRLRRALTKRFSARSARAYQEQVAAIVAEQLQRLLDSGPPADLTQVYAQPISARVHCLVLGVPEELVEDFTRCFVHGAPAQRQHDLLREVIAHRRAQPGEDVASDLLAGDLSTAEVLGLMYTLSMSGRDTVAYFIATATVALLGDPAQLEVLRADPDLLPAALEEIVRYGTMFLTLFPRTALEDVQVGETVVPAGTTLSVSPVAANRDPRHWQDPERLDVRRDARGHLGFGDGLHMCVGQRVARMELAAALRQLIIGVPTLQLVHADQLMPQPLAHPVATYEAGSVIVSW